MRRAFFCIALFLLTLGASAQRIVLREGILVHPTEAIAYMMVPGEAIAAVDLTTGEPLWRTTAASKPLLLVGDRLLGQIQPSTIAERDDLLLAALDAGKRGALLTRGGLDLPDDVIASVTETPQGHFFIVARHVGPDSAKVEWEFLPAPRRGIRALRRAEERQERREDRREDGPPGLLREILGALRINLATGAIGDVMSKVELEPPDHPEDWLIAGSDTDDEPGTDYRSADGRTLLKSERLVDDREWDNYRWTITDATSGERLGEIRTFIAFAPFVVRNGVLVFETTPYVRRDEVQPAKLRGYDLATGKEKWNFEVREVVFRGSTPP